MIIVGSIPDSCGQRVVAKNRPNENRVGGLFCICIEISFYSAKTPVRNLKQTKHLLIGTAIMEVLLLYRVVPKVQRKSHSQFLIYIRIDLEIYIKGTFIKTVLSQLRTDTDSSFEISNKTHTNEKDIRVYTNVLSTITSHL